MGKMFGWASSFFKSKENKAQEQANLAEKKRIGKNNREAIQIKQVESDKKSQLENVKAAIIEKERKRKQDEQDKKAPLEAVKQAIIEKERLRKQDYEEKRAPLENVKKAIIEKERLRKEEESKDNQKKIDLENVKFAIIEKERIRKEIERETLQKEKKLASAKIRPVSVKSSIIDVEKRVEVKEEDEKEKEKVEESWTTGKTDDEIDAEKNLARIMSLDCEKERMEELCKLNKVNAKKLVMKRNNVEPESSDVRDISKLRNLKRVSSDSKNDKKDTDCEAVAVDIVKIHEEEKNKSLQIVKNGIIEKERIRKEVEFENKITMMKQKIDDHKKEDEETDNRKKLAVDKLRLSRSTSILIDVKEKKKTNDDLIKEKEAKLKIEIDRRSKEKKEKLSYIH